VSRRRPVPKGTKGFAFEPDMSDPAQAIVHRAVEACKRALMEEFGSDVDVPNVTVVTSVPPDGRIGVASTEPNAELVHEVLMLGMGATRGAMRARASRQ
jgi:hypothetical protein